METLKTPIPPDDPQFLANKKHNLSLVHILRERLAIIRAGGGEKYRKRHEEQGKLFVRERIERLLDPGAPFLELSTLAAFDMYDLEAPGAGIVTRIPMRLPLLDPLHRMSACARSGPGACTTFKKHLRAQ